MIVRHAVRGDAPTIIEMGRALAQESGRYRGMGFDEAKLMAIGDRMQAAIEADNPFACVLVAESAGQVVGMMVGLVTERWFSMERYATDLTVYVKPEHRGGTAFYRLVCAFEEWVEEQGIEDVDIGVSTGIHTEQTVRAYERMGYTLSPTRIVTKKLPHGT